METPNLSHNNSYWTKEGIRKSQKTILYIITAMLVLMVLIFSAYKLEFMGSILMLLLESACFIMVVIGAVCLFLLAQHYY